MAFNGDYYASSAHLFVLGSCRGNQKGINIVSENFRFEYTFKCKAVKKILITSIKNL